MNLNMTSWRESVLASRERQAVPVLTSLGYSMLGRPILAGLRDGAIHAGAVKVLAEKYRFAAAPMMMDLSVEAEAFGAPVSFSDNEIPVVSAPCLGPNKTIQDLRTPSPADGRLPEFLKASRLAAEAIRDRPVFAGCIGPFSLAGRLFGMSELMIEMLMAPDSIDMLLGKCTEFLSSYVAAYKQAGANGILMAEPAAGLLSPEMCDEFSSRYIRRIVDEVQDENFLFILHNCGNTGHQNASMLSTGAKALHLGNKNPLSATMKEIPGDVLVLGNLDPVKIKRGTPEEIREEACALLEATRAYPNFILSSGCDIPPGVPKENIDAIMEAVDSYNAGQKQP